MKFKVGDHVVHSSQGQGQILAIEQKQFADSSPRSYYVVAVNKSTIWVPVAADSQSSLRLVAGPNTLEHCREVLKSRPAKLNDNRRQRYLDVATIIQEGSFEKLCEVVRDLSAYGRPKPLSEADSSALRKVRDAVCQEWAVAAGISQSAALHEITELLKEGLKAVSV